MGERETYNRVLVCEDCTTVIENGVIIGGKAYCMQCALSPDRLANAVEILKKA